MCAECTEYRDIKQKRMKRHSAAVLINNSINDSRRGERNTEPLNFGAVYPDLYVREALNSNETSTSCRADNNHTGYIEPADICFVLRASNCQIADKNDIGDRKMDNVKQIDIATNDRFDNEGWSIAIRYRVEDIDHGGEDSGHGNSEESESKGSSRVANDVAHERRVLTMNEHMKYDWKDCASKQVRC